MLDKVTNIVTIIACTVLVLYIGYTAYPKASRPRDIYEVGEIAKVSFPVTKHTLVFFTSSRCPHCVRMAPTMAALAKQARAKHVAVVIAAMDTPAEQGAFLVQHGIESDLIISGKMAGLLFTGTPSTLLLDGSKRILGVWRGELSTEQAAMVAALLEGGSR